jgi:amino-acid N-acetyltransferase
MAANKPHTYQLRPADQADARTIRAMIRAARLNPFSLDWRRFWVAHSAQGEVVGVGQIKPHADGSQELASIAVLPAWRGRGVASAIIQQLLADQPGVMYLTCRRELEGFYARFGFRLAPGGELHPYFRRLQRTLQILEGLHVLPRRILIMVRPGLTDLQSN